MGGQRVGKHEAVAEGQVVFSHGGVAHSMPMSKPVVVVVVLSALGEGATMQKRAWFYIRERGR